MFRGRKLINDFIFSNNHQCNYTKTISRLRRRENDLEMECLWFCFSSLIQHDLDTVKDHWNTHFIRGSRHETVSGRPDQLFFLPELHSAQDYKHSVTEERCQHILENHLSVKESRNEYEEYFEYVTGETDLTPPKDWREGLDLYSHLIDLANHGS